MPLMATHITRDARAAPAPGRWIRRATHQPLRPSVTIIPSHERAGQQRHRAEAVAGRARWPPSARPGSRCRTRRRTARPRPSRRAGCRPQGAVEEAAAPARERDRRARRGLRARRPGSACPAAPASRSTPRRRRAPASRARPRRGRSARPPNATASTTRAVADREPQAGAPRQRRAGVGVAARHRVDGRQVVGVHAVAHAQHQRDKRQAEQGRSGAAASWGRTTIDPGRHARRVPCPRRPPGPSACPADARCRVVRRRRPIRNGASRLVVGRRALEWCSARCQATPGQREKRFICEHAYCFLVRRLRNRTIVECGRPFAKEEDGELETRRRPVPAAGRGDGAGDARRIRVPGTGNGAQEEPGQRAGEDPGGLLGLDRRVFLHRLHGGVRHQLLRRRAAPGAAQRLRARALLLPDDVRGRGAGDRVGRHRRARDASSRRWPRRRSSSAWPTRAGRRGVERPLRHPGRAARLVRRAVPRLRRQRRGARDGRLGRAARRCCCSGRGSIATARTAPSARIRRRTSRSSRSAPGCWRSAGSAST